MEYLEYFEKYPDAYDKVVAGFDRSRTLYDYLVTGGFLDGVSSLLSIGSGDGEVEVRLAKERGLRIGVVEPSSLLFGRCKENISKAGVGDQIFEAQEQSFEDYKPLIQYDLVLSLYSWFAFGFDRPMLEKALTCLKPTGKLIICIQSEKSPSTQISAASRSSGINLTSEALSKFYADQGFVHETDTYHGTVPADRYIVAEQLTQSGRDLVSFLTATPWDEMSADLRSLGLDSLSKAMRGGVVGFESGCLIFHPKSTWRLVDQ